MFRLHKLIFTGLSIFMLVALTACNMGQAAEPTPTSVDVTAIYLAAVGTAQAQMTLNAPSITPTILPSETSAEGVTKTPGIVPIEETSALTPTGTLLAGEITITPTITPFGATAAPSLTPIGGGAVVGGPTAQLCKNAAFDGDITIPDGTVMKPWEKFTKAWSIRNTGTCKWDEGFYFAAISGPPSMGKNQGPYKFRSAKDFIGPGESVIIYIEMYAPGDPGEYVAHWHMYDDNGQPFGGDFTVVIKVAK